MKISSQMPKKGRMRPIFIETEQLSDRTTKRRKKAAKAKKSFKVTDNKVVKSVSYKDIIQIDQILNIDEPIRAAHNKIK